MSIRFRCKKCGKGYKVGDDKAGKRVQCRQCDAALQIPDAVVEGSSNVDQNNISSALNPSPATAPMESKTTEKKTLSPVRNQKRLLLGAGIAVAILLAGVFGFLMFSSKDSTRTVNAETPNINASSKKSSTTKTTKRKRDRSRMDAERFFAVHNKLKMFGLAFHNFHEANRGLVPDPKKYPQYFDKKGQLKVSWRVHLLPYLNEPALYKRFKLDEPWDSPTNAAIAKNMPDIFRSPGMPANSNLTRFCGFTEPLDSVKDVPTSLFPRGTNMRFRDIKDGLSNTILVVEAGAEQAVEWTKPGGLDVTSPLKSMQPTEVSIPSLFSEGRIHLIKGSVDDTTWKKLIHPTDQSEIDLKSITTDYAKPWKEEPPPTGPLHLAYLSHDCDGIVIMHPKSILETPGSDYVIAPRLINMLSPLFSSRKNKKEWDSRLVETAVMWFNGKSEGWFAVRFTEPVSLETFRKNVSVNAIQHDSRTFLVAHDSELARMFAYSNRHDANHPLVDHLKAASVDSQFYMAIQPKTVFNQERIPFQINAGLSQLAFQKELVSNSKMLEFKANLTGPLLIDFTAHLANPNVANQTKKMIEDEWKLTLGQTSPPHELKIRKQLYPAIKLKVEQNKLRYELPNSTELVDQIKTYVTKFNAIAAEKKQHEEAAAKVAAEAKQKRDQMKKIRNAFSGYSRKYKRLPLANLHLVDERSFLSWRVHLLPFIGQSDLYNKFHLQEYWGSPHNMKLLNQMPDLYKCDGVTKPGHTLFMTFFGENTPFTIPSSVSFDTIAARDGLVRTILFVKAGPDNSVPWTKPTDLLFEPENPIKILGQLPNGSFEACMADGTVRTIKADIPIKTLNQLIQHDDGGKPNDF